MKKLFTILICTFILSSILSAQNEETLLGSTGISLTGIWGGSSQSMAEFEGNFNHNKSGYFLFEVNNDILIGWSGYGNGDFLDNGDKVNIGGHDLVIGYGFNSSKVVHPVVYLKGGGGSLKINDQEEDRITVFQPTVGVELNVTKWFRLGLEGGYRFITNVDSPNVADTDFSSPVVGLRFKFGYSWRD